MTKTIFTFRYPCLEVTKMMSDTNVNRFPMKLARLRCRQGVKKNYSLTSRAYADWVRHRKQILFLFSPFVSMTTWSFILLTSFSDLFYLYINDSACTVVAYPLWHRTCSNGFEHLTNFETKQHIFFLIHYTFQILFSSILCF